MGKGPGGGFDNPKEKSQQELLREEYSEKEKIEEVFNEICVWIDNDRPTIDEHGLQIYNKLKKPISTLEIGSKFLGSWNANISLSWIKGFLFIWVAKSNFFVTILDYMGNTLVTWSGGNTGWTGTKQRSTVFSADNAIYECCFLAKEWGLESVIIHIRSSLWVQQIKHCFDGLSTSGLIVEHVVYWPIKSFGGCWAKKAWRV